MFKNAETSKLHEVKPTTFSQTDEVKPIIYTTGYTGKDFEDLKPLIEHLNAVLVDIRFSPQSRRPEWTQDYLKLLLKNRYRHVAQLGNRTFRENRITIQNLDLGIKTVLSFGINAVLFCGCEEFAQCHRAVIALDLRRRGIETEEITNWKHLESSLF